MADSALARDALFQLNVLVWAFFPQPPDAPVTPLVDTGYSLWTVEQPLEAGLTELASLRLASNITANPVADAVLFHEGRNEFVLVECKPATFGPGSDRAAHQARGFIVAAGAASSRLGVGGQATGEACHVVPFLDAGNVDQTLASLAEELSDGGFQCGPTGAVGIDVRSDGVYLGIDQQPTGTAHFPSAILPARRVIGAALGQDPRPLYLVPWIPNSEGSDLTALREKVRALMIVWLGRARTPGTEMLSLDQLLDDVTRGVFRYWRNRDSLRGEVLPVVGRIITALFTNDPRVHVRLTDVEFVLTSEQNRQQLIEMARTAKLSGPMPQGVQLSLEGPPTP